MSADNKTKAQFDKAVQIVKDLPEDGDDQLSQAEKLAFYAFYKQATEGDVDVPRPGMMEFTKKAKWDAWKLKEGTSKEEAQAEYVKLLRQYLEKASDREESKKLLAQVGLLSLQSKSFG